MIHLGFSGTQLGLAKPQLDAVRSLIDRITIGLPFTARHVDCIGADRSFHLMCRQTDRARIIGHPGLVDGKRAFCVCDELTKRADFLRRNRDIVDASQVMICAPYEDTEQERGGTWSTYRYAKQCVLRASLRGLYLVKPDGTVEDHGGWDL